MERKSLERDTADLEREIDSLRELVREKASLRDLLSDVQVYHKAVRWALAYDEFYRSNEIAIARTLLKQGLERARQLRSGNPTWISATGLIVRGYISKIDGSVQPYGLLVPAGFSAGAIKPHRLDVWLHGRDNNLTELKFINDRQRSVGEFAPHDTFVLHPYGRYCNAFKFAGEVDVFEALEHVRKHYPIDGQRLAVRGFSMGGAGCWHLAVHHSGLWAAAAPGAGFAETADYTKALTKEPKPPWYEQKLWHLYDATDYALNLFNCPTIAYSGELDKQKQAADLMARAMHSEGLELAHVIGPGVEHRYEPGAKKELARRFDEVMDKGRDPVRKNIRFTTWTLRYNHVGWLSVDGLVRHWERARVEGELREDKSVRITSAGVTALTISLPDAEGSPDKIMIDGKAARGSVTRDGEKWIAKLVRNSTGSWSPGPFAGVPLHKLRGLQGPIDDAFMDAFIMVRPTGQPLTQQLGAWTASELAHATNQWRAQFRGDARVMNDTVVTDADIAGNNLILWGDSRSNKLLARIADKLPMRWNRKEVRIGERAFNGATHIPVLIYPNPLNPKRYVVVNSGFTFCDFGAASNAQQTPKLPDFAVVDMTVPRAERLSSGVVLAGFFDDDWH